MDGEEKTELADDYWADTLAAPWARSRRRILLVASADDETSAQNELEDDRWADSAGRRLGKAYVLPSRAAPSRSAPANCLAPKGSTADGLDRRASVARRPGVFIADYWADDLPPIPPTATQRDQATPSSGLAKKRPRVRDGCVLKDDSWADAAAVIAKKAQAPAALALAGVDAASVASAEGAPRSMELNIKPADKTACADRGPEIPAEYHGFAGRVVQVHAHDESAGAQFAEIFSRRRFEEAFPAAAGLPLLVGLDFEWKPDRRPGDNNPIALIQFACWDTALIIRTTGCAELPEWLTECLEDETFAKIVASFDLSDKKKLQTSFGWDCDARAKSSSFVDIAELAKKREIFPGMWRMAHFFGITMLKLKAVGKSNWAATNGLSAAQRAYAADDAFFQLFLVGKLLEHQDPETDDAVLKNVLASWRATRESMVKSTKLVDNRAYRNAFFQLREAVRGAVVSLSNALGSGGWATLNDVRRIKDVAQALTSTPSSCAIALDNHFMRQNEDIFIVYIEPQLVKVRLRSNDEEDEENDCEREGETEETGEGAVDEFQAEILERLVAYEPPIEKRPTVLTRNVPEPFWVPARAILSKKQQARLEACADRLDSIETSFSDEDGLLVRLSRHPRAADDMEHMDRCVCRLAGDLKIDETEARSRLNDDDKFMQLWGTLRILERASAEEVHVERSLRARVRILGDSQRTAQRISPPIGWTEAREALEKVKWYRQLLSHLMNNSLPGAEAEVEACLDEIVAAWPDVEKVKGPKKRKRAAAEEGSKKRKSQGTGKGKSEGKGQTTEVP